MLKKKKAIIAFLGNLNYDTRSFNLYKSLTENNIEVRVIAFDWLTPGFLTKFGGITIYRLDKSKSSLFYYLNFLFLLTKNLLINKADYYFAEDVYTLPLVSIFSKIYGGKLYYDSRELYGHLAGLTGKRKTQSILAFLEKLFIRYIVYVLVTGEMDADYLINKYKNINTILLRNLPLYKTEFHNVDLKDRFKIKSQNKIILYQGVVLKGRGLLPTIDALKNITNYTLLVLGDGDYRKELISIVENYKISEKVIFGGKVDQMDLLNFTHSADIGLAIIENLSLSYYYALPNKLFEYIMAEIPVIVSDLPQMRNIVEKYKVGVIVSPNNIEEIQKGFETIVDNYDTYKQNCIIAKEELNWENEVSNLLKTL
ncbi:MAG: glycosyltransferase [Ignavibacteria bacterium]|nr:glycosyltransferase [Ignavibacteria bacterium]